MGFIIGKGISIHRQGGHSDHRDTKERGGTGEHAVSAGFGTFVNPSNLTHLAVLVILAAVLVLLAGGTRMSAEGDRSHQSAQLFQPSYRIIAQRQQGRQ